MKEYVESFQFKYYEQMHYLCMKSIFFQYLDLLGCENSLLYMKVGNEIKIQAKAQEIAIYKHFPLMPFYEMNRIRSGKGEKFDSIFEENRKEMPLVVLCDVFYLPYRKEYRKYHAVHAVILYDYHEEEQTVGVVDWYAPHFFRGNIPLGNYKMARMSQNPADANIFSGYAVENYWYKLENESNLLSIHENYDRNVSEMFQNDINLEKGIYRGKAAFPEIIKQLKQMYEGSEEAVKKAMSYYHNEFFTYFRTMIFATLYYKEANEKLGYDSAAEYMRFCDNNAKLLDRANKIFMRASMRPSMKYVDDLVAQFEAIEKNYLDASCGK